ncbi:hypothetical protein ON010_g536 [Phytophthora cinnamomi]|nr:hypothetical protein ON010_g536 [Phytophthora cinnamomi]
MVTYLHLRLRQRQLVDRRRGHREHSAARAAAQFGHHPAGLGDVQRPAVREPGPVPRERGRASVARAKAGALGGIPVWLGRQAGLRGDGGRRQSVGGAAPAHLHRARTAQGQQGGGTGRDHGHGRADPAHG